MNSPDRRAPENKINKYYQKTKLTFKSIILSLNIRKYMDCHMVRFAKNVNAIRPSLELRLSMSLSLIIYPWKSLGVIGINSGGDTNGSKTTNPKSLKYT